LFPVELIFRQIDRNPFCDFGVSEELQEEANPAQGSAILHIRSNH
jgi:hypothetical protein